MIERGALFWADLGAAKGSRPAKLRPVLIVSADSFNRSGLATVLALVVTSNTEKASLPGNVFLPAVASGLPKDSVVNVTGLVTLNKSDLHERAGTAPLSLMHAVDRGLRLALDV